MIRPGDIVQFSTGKQRGYALIEKITSKGVFIDMISTIGFGPPTNIINRRHILVVYHKEVPVKAERPKCAYCGRLYDRKKKSQRFCTIKCKDKWWNRERRVNLDNPMCDDNFSGEA